MAGDDQSNDLFDAVLYDALAIKYPQKVKHIYSAEMREKLEHQRKSIDFMTLTELLRTSRKRKASASENGTVAKKPVTVNGTSHKDSSSSEDEPVKKPLAKAIPPKVEESSSSSEDEPVKKPARPVPSKPAPKKAQESSSSSDEEPVKKPAPVKAAPPKPAPKKAEESDSSSEDEPVKKLAPVKAAPPKLTPKKPADSDSSSDEEPPAKKPAPVKAAPKKAKESSSSSDEEPPVKKSPVKAAPPKPTPKKAEESDSSSDEEPVKKPTPAKVAPPKPTPKKPADSDSSSDEEPPVKKSPVKAAPPKPTPKKAAESDSSSDEEPAKKPAAKAAPPKPPTPKKPVDSDSSSDEEPPAKKPAPVKAAPAKPTPKKPADSDSSSDDELPVKKSPVKAAPPKPTPKKAAESSDSSSDEKPAKKPAPVKATPLKPTPKKPAESSDSSSEDEKPVKKTSPVKAVTPKVAPKKVEESSSSSEEEVAPKKSPVKAAPPKPTPKKPADSDSSSDDELVKKPPVKAAPAKPAPKKAKESSSSSEDEPPVKKSPVKAAPPKPTPKKAAESSDSSSEDEPVKKPAPAKVAPPKPTPKKPAESSDSSSEEEKPVKKTSPVKAAPPKPTPKKTAESSSDSEEDEPAKKSPVKAAPAKPTPKKPADSDSSSEEDEPPKQSSPVKSKTSNASAGNDENIEEPMEVDESLDTSNVSQKNNRDTRSNGRKSNEPFRRVTMTKDQLPEKLRDNSYRADADPWGQRAFQDLSKVQGRNFRHEKTKKKRGSYGGGQISKAMVETMDLNDTTTSEVGPSTDKDVYANLCAFVNHISQPLANRKLAKKVYKLVQKAAADKKTVRQGVADVLKAMRKKEKGIVILAGNVTPIDIYSHLPVACEDNGIPYVFTPSREHLGLATGHRRPAIVLMVLKDDEYADLYDEVHEIGLTLAKENGTSKGSSGGISAQEKSFLTKVHGISFIFAWFFCVSTAVMGARFLKEYLPDVQPFGIRIWFHIHRTLNVIGVVLMICGLTSILIAHEWRWLGPKVGGSSNTDPKSLHSIFGVFTVGIAWIQPINSLVRCAPNDPKRPYFNWIHRILGILGWILSAVTITIACKNFGQKFSDQTAAISICAAFLGFCGASFIVAEFYRIRRSSKVNDSYGLQEKKEEKWSFHSIMVLIFGITALVVCISLAVLIASSK